MRLLLPAQILVAALVFAALAFLAPSAAATGWRVAFLTICGPMIGAVLMLAIARLTGADWPAFEPIALATPILLAGAIGIGLSQVASPAPSHLARWQGPIAVGMRSLVAAGAVAWTGRRIAAHTGITWVAIGLALYAVVVTVVGSDWMLGGAPGHAVSAVGMILFVEEIGGACALVLLLGWGQERFRRDMGKMLAACGLGLSYLVFMDYLVLWYGDLPSRVGWYAVRSAPPMVAIALSALGAGLVVPIAAQALIGGDRGLRIAGGFSAIGLLLLNLWWTDAGWRAFIAAVAAGWLLASIAVFVPRGISRG